MNANNIIHFESFGLEHVPKQKLKTSIVSKNIIINIYKIHFCIEFIDFMLKGYDYEK